MEIKKTKTTFITSVLKVVYWVVLVFSISNFFINKNSQRRKLSAKKSTYLQYFSFSIWHCDLSLIIRLHMRVREYYFKIRNLSLLVKQSHSNYLIFEIETRVSCLANQCKWSISLMASKLKSWTSNMMHVAKFRCGVFSHYLFWTKDY